MKKLISFELKSEFGFLKKPDINKKEIFITYNCLHKPALLGILGAITGLKGFQRYGKLPEYYEKFKDIKISIKPLIEDRGIFSKTLIKYNNATGFGNKDATEKYGETLNVTEQTLLNPFFKCYVELDDEVDTQKLLIDNLIHLKSEYITYFGKNEYSAWWNNPQIHRFKPFIPQNSYNIDSIFTKIGIINEQIAEEDFNIFTIKEEDSMFMYYEKLPIGFINLKDSLNEELKAEVSDDAYQYEIKSFVFTNRKLRNDSSINNLYQLDDNGEIIQLF